MKCKPEVKKKQKQRVVELTKEGETLKNADNEDLINGIGIVYQELP